MLARSDVHPPWFCAPCIAPAPDVNSRSAKEFSLKTQFCGWTCCRAARLPFTHFDPGEDQPFLPSSRPHDPADLPGPPARFSAARFSNAFGIHAPTCGGRLLLTLNGGGENLLWISVLLLVVPTAAWAAFVARDVAEEAGSGMVLAVALVAALAHVFLALTYLTEPGILPTLSFEEQGEDPERAAASHVYVYLHGRYFDKRLFRAQRSRFTSSMIEVFDHYCPWVSNAVAKRNHRYFFFFIASAFALGALVVASCSVVLVKRAPDANPWHVVEREPACLVLGIYALLLSLSLTHLVFYHARLVSKGVTTAEDLKHKFPSGNPYNPGCIDSWAVLCCGPHWPSRVVADQVLDESEAQSDLAQLLLSPSTPASRGANSGVISGNSSGMAAGRGGRGTPAGGAGV
jgi:hypothetical protein